MIKIAAVIFFMSAAGWPASAQLNSLPLREWNASGQLPFVLYLTGDGGFSSFSTTLCATINKSGYDIVAINSKSYFWDRKTPVQTALAASDYLKKKFENRINQQLIMIGYSFGADVMPFIVNNLHSPVRDQLICVVLVSPSTSTDFEIHWSDMFGGKAKRSMDVVAEINKMYVPKTATFFGAEEGDFPIGKVQLKNYHNQILPGGHRFDGHIARLAELIIREFK